MKSLIGILFLLVTSVAMAAPSPFIWKSSCSSGIYDLSAKACYSAGGGANATLSNLTSPTAVNKDLTFDTGADASISTKADTAGSKGLGLSTGAVSSGSNPSGSSFLSTGNAYSGSSGEIDIFTGNSNSADSAPIYMNSGGGYTTSGALWLGTGNCGQAACTSGDVNLFVGTTNAGTKGKINLQSDAIFDTGAVAYLQTKNNNAAATKDLRIRSGDVAGAFNSGFIKITSGNSQGTQSGEVDLFSGDITSGTGASGPAFLFTGDTSGSGKSGNLQVYTGISNSDVSGNVSVYTGDANGTNSGSGTVSINSGASNGTGTSGDVTVSTGTANGAGVTGILSLLSGTAATAGAGSGAVLLKSGGGNTTGGTGDVTVQSGDAGSTGQLNLKTGNATGGGNPSGTINIVTGDADWVGTGDIQLVTGSAGGGGTRGVITLNAYRTNVQSLLHMNAFGAGATPTGATAGDLALTSGYKLCVYNGSAWKNASDGSTGCTF